MKYLIVAFGAGIGGALRFWISANIYKFLPALFPYGTLIVNVLGSFILGILIFGFAEREVLNSGLKLLLGVGFCGGLTTFSTFSIETLSLFRESEYYFAFMNIFLNVILTLAAGYSAFILTKYL